MTKRKKIDIENFTLVIYRTGLYLLFNFNTYATMLTNINLLILFCIYSFVSMKTFTFALALQLKSHNNNVKERW